MQDCKVNILGTEYNVFFDLKDEEADGEARFYKKEIHIRPIDKMLDKDSSYQEKLNRAKEVYRHEVIHCALFEMGADEWSRDENLTNLLAINTPKIFKVFQELDIL